MTDLRQFGSFPTIKNHVEVLVLGDWIERVEDDKDRRIVILRPMPKSLEIMKSITEELRKHPDLLNHDDANTVRHRTLAEVSSLFEEFKTRFMKPTETSNSDHPLAAPERLD